MKKSLMRVMVLLAVFVFLSITFLPAQDNPIKIQEKDQLIDVLMKYSGQRVELILQSGMTLSGRVSEVTANLVHISQLAGKEFYDAVIRTDDISGVIVRVK